MLGRSNMVSLSAVVKIPQLRGALLAGHAGTHRAFSSMDYPPPRGGIDWDKLGFSMHTKETKMIMATTKQGQMWGQCNAVPYGELSLEPAATILNYGQGIFEGLKAYRTTKGRIVIFRPHKNAQRMNEGARRFLMAPIPTQLFLEAIGMAVRENADLVPPCGKGALYLRPLLFGSGSDLGVKPSSMYTFVTYVSPVGQYFSGNQGARMQLCTEHHRAAPLGVGNTKCAGNYAQCFSAQREAKADGFSDVIYLDVGGENIEEAAASNFFCVTSQGTHKVVHTPQLGTILPGVTRDSLIQLLRRLNDPEIHLKVGKVSTKTALSATEAFVTGTGAGISPISHISSDEESADYEVPGPVTTMLSKMLYDIKLERASDKLGWLHDPFESPTYGLDSFWEPSF